MRTTSVNDPEIEKQAASIGVGIGVLARVVFSTKARFCALISKTALVWTATLSRQEIAAHHLGRVATSDSRISPGTATNANGEVGRRKETPVFDGNGRRRPAALMCSRVAATRTTR